MQFDHVPERGEKLGDISTLLWKWTSWRKLRAELDKCDLICAECHIRRTLARRGRVFVRLSAADENAIRRRRVAGERCADIAADYGITEQRVASICRRRRGRRSGRGRLAVQRQ
jgi:hypothetical protein